MRGTFAVRSKLGYRQSLYGDRDADRTRCRVVRVPAVRSGQRVRRDCQAGDAGRCRSRGGKSDRASVARAVHFKLHGAGRLRAG